MAELKARLRADLTTAMKARDTRTTGVLRMALGGGGRRGGRRQAGTRTVRRRGAARAEPRGPQRKEAAEAFDGAGRAEQAQAELAEADVLSTYLPSHSTTPS